MLALALAPDANLTGAWNALLAPWSTGVQVGPQGASGALETLMPTTTGKRARHGGASAYVCVHGACNAPTGDPARLRRELLAGWTR